MRKKILHLEEKEMDAATFVDHAREMAAMIEDRITTDTHSRPKARERAARIVGVPESLLHTLRYRPPKTIAADVYVRLCIAIERQALNQIRNLENEISAARACRRGVDDRALCEAEAALQQARAYLKSGSKHEVG